MPDAALDWQGDLSLTPSGDLATVDGNDFTEQKIVRRLLTAVNGYEFHLEYGAGLPERIGRTTRLRTISSLVRSQIGLEASVASVPVPVINVTEVDNNPGLFVISIAFTNAITGVATAISFEVPGTA